MRTASTGPAHRTLRGFTRTRGTYRRVYLVTQGIVLHDDDVPSQANDEGDGLAQLRRELARGTAELALLSVLSSGRRYGYEMLKLLHGGGAGVLEVKEGTLYPLLHRLEDAGHVVAEWEAEGRARPRKYYAITASGRQRLALLRAEWSGLVDALGALLETLDSMEREGDPAQVGRNVGSTARGGTTRRGGRR